MDQPKKFREFLINMRKYADEMAIKWENDTLMCNYWMGTSHAYGQVIYSLHDYFRDTFGQKDFPSDSE